MPFDDDYIRRFWLWETTIDEDIEAMSDLVRRQEQHCVRGYFRRMAQTAIHLKWIDEKGNIL